MNRPKTIPSILGLILLLAAAIGGSYATTQRTSLLTRASSSCSPNNLIIANVTSNSADISFNTSTDCLAVISIKNRTIQDVRKANNPNTKTKTHYFEITNLEASTTYSFQVLADGKTYSQTRTIKTLSGIIKGQDGKLAWGRIYTPDKKPGAWAIVYISIPDANPLSAYVTSAGNWNLPLSALSSSEGSEISLDQTLEENIIVYGPDLGVTNLQNTTDNNNPVPDIILGQNFFTKTQSVNVVTSSGSLPKDNSGSIQPDNRQLNISYPAENEQVGNQRPEFNGSASANGVVSLSLTGPTNINGSVVASSQGLWRYSPYTDLAVGQYRLAAQLGTNTATRNFNITSNRTLAFISTPSASLAPTIPPTPTLIPTPTDLPTPTIAIRAPKPSGNRLPTSGNGGPTAVLVILSALVILSGLAFLHP